MTSQSELHWNYAATDRTVALVGPIAVPGTPAAGGFEAANARLIQLLARLGVNSVALPYPSVKEAGKLRKAWAYWTALHRIEGRIRSLPAGTIVHFTPLARQFLCGELWLARIAAAHGRKVVIDLRAGTKDIDFVNRSFVYRMLFRRLIACADVVAVEGERYINFVRGVRPGLPVYYLPNFLPDADIPVAPVQRHKRPIRFVYAGSVNEAKGVAEATRLVAAVAAAGFGVRFDVFGRIQPSFIERLRKEAGGAPWLVLHGPQPFNIIRDALAEAHFFAFLSQWDGEGHSNALTEAMSQGAIPIITDHGFNVHVAGPDAIVVGDRKETGPILARVQGLCDSPVEMAARSARLIARVRERYSESAVVTTLEAIYSRAGP